MADFDFITDALNVRPDDIEAFYQTFYCYN